MATNSPESTCSDLLPIQQLALFCTKNKLPIPLYQKQTCKIGFYKLLVSLEIPVAGKDEPIRFEKEAICSKKREAEENASLAMLAELQEWLSENTPPDTREAKKNLISFIQQNENRLGPPKYAHEPIEASYFQCKIFVADRIQTDREYSEVGKGRTKKQNKILKLAIVKERKTDYTNVCRDAEKDAAYRLLNTLKLAIQENAPQSSSKDSVEELAQKFVFPEHELKYLPYAPADNSELLLKIWKLVIVKEGQPILTVAICTHQDDEGAKELCAGMFLSNFDTIDQRLKGSASDKTQSLFD